MTLFDVWYARAECFTWHEKAEWFSTSCESGEEAWSAAWKQEADDLIEILESMNIKE